MDALSNGKAATTRRRLADLADRRGMLNSLTLLGTVQKCFASRLRIPNFAVATLS